MKRRRSSNLYPEANQAFDPQRQAVVNSVNHMHGITGLEEFDKDLYQRLAKEK